MQKNYLFVIHLNELFKQFSTHFWTCQHAVNLCKKNESKYFSEQMRRFFLVHYIAQFPILWFKSLCSHIHKTFASHRTYRFKLVHLVLNSVVNSILKCLGYGTRCPQVLTPLPKSTQFPTLQATTVQYTVVMRLLTNKLYKLTDF